MPLYHLSHAIDEYRKRHPKSDGIINDRGPTGELYDEVESAIEGWPYQVIDMMDVHYWRLNRLIDEHRHLGRPRIFLNVFFTTKDNLALEWYPSWPLRRQYGGDVELESTDWTYWSNSWSPEGGMPFSRIIMIRGVDHHFFRRKDKAVSPVEEHLLRAMNTMFQDATQLLRAHFNVEIINYLSLDYIEHKRTKKRKVCGCSILNEAEEEVKRAEAARAHYLKETFEDNLGITPADLLDALKSNDMMWTATFRQISEQIKPDAVFSIDRMKTMLRKLYREYPGIYDEALSKPLLGEEPRPLKEKGSVIEVDFKGRSEPEKE